MFLPSAFGPFTQFIQQATAGQQGPVLYPGPRLPIPFEGSYNPSPFGGSYKGLSGPGMVPISLPSGFGGIPQGNPFQNLWGLMQGSNSGGMGMRGPAPNPFQGLLRFSGPFGNGGGPISPSFSKGQVGWGGNWQMF